MKLNQCPNCQATEFDTVIYNNGKTKTYSFECKKCHLQSPVGVSEADAQKQHNTFSNRVTGYKTLLSRIVNYDNLFAKVELPVSDEIKQEGFAYIYDKGFRELLKEASRLSEE